MKDWKFIKVGNSYTKGQVLEEVNGRKYVFGGEINGTYLVHIQPYGKTYSFSSEQEIKDWLRNSKIGNESINVPKEVMDVLRDRYNKALTESQAYEKLKSMGLDEEKAKRLSKNPGNFTQSDFRVNNESIDKQEWSMFKGLTKDAEKEIGNFTKNYRYKDFLITNPDGYEYIIYLKDGFTVAHIARDKVMAELWCDAHDAKTGKLRTLQPKSQNKKTGNADTVSEYNAEIQRLTKKAEQLRRMGQGKSAMEIEKQIEKLGKELSELGNKKVGNAFDAGIHLTIRYNGKEEEVKVLKDMPTSVVVKGQNGAVVEIKKVDLDVLKVHNETKGERKFGKVMGEFEEGALKTPQGKTVTDPAQAKAIAYSEADKVENTWEWNVKQSDVIDYINGNPTATDIQRICVKHLGTYDTTGVEAYLVDKNSNKWAVVKKGTKPTVKSVNNLKRARKAMNKKTGNSDDLDIALKKNKEEFNKSREREKEFRKKASEYFNSGDKRNSDFYVKMAESETKMQDEITKRIIDIEKKINK